MKRIAAISLSLLATAVCADAQTFLQHLQQQKQGEGRVVVTQSKDIDDLVNGTKPTKTTTMPAGGGNPSARQNKTSETQPKPSQTQEKNQQQREKTGTASTSATHKGGNGTSGQPAQTEENNAEPVDMHKKVMRRSYKVNGYRVQVFAGGNSRNDKVKAQKAGNSVKRAFPDQPIYVHFYSPRWICRMGNYRTYEEASQMLRQVKELGFSEACIVSGKIVVPY